MHAPYVVPGVEAALATCRAALGEAAFEAALRTARATPLADLATEALASSPAPAPRRQAGSAPAAPADDAPAHGGESPGPPHGGAGPAWASPAARAAGLTPREWEVLALLAGGASNRAIAERLVISPHTAVRHVASVLAKLGARSRGAAVARATGLGNPESAPRRGNAAGAGPGAP
jgi:DNA-binding NarL/FixJ family response regulator